MNNFFKSSSLFYMDKVSVGAWWTFLHIGTGRKILTNLVIGINKDLSFTLSVNIFSALLLLQAHDLSPKSPCNLACEPSGKN